MFCSLLKRSLDETHAVRALMRSMYFSNGTIDGFLATATAGQVSAVRGLIASELELRDRRKRERLVRKARFPQVKSSRATTSPRWPCRRATGSTI